MNLFLARISIFFLGTFLSLIVGFLPEWIMALIWHFIHPTAESLQVGLFTFFVILGGVPSTAFAILGVIMFIATVQATLDGRWVR